MQFGGHGQGGLYRSESVSGRVSFEGEFRAAWVTNV